MQVFSATATQESFESVMDVLERHLDEGYSYDFYENHWEFVRIRRGNCIYRIRRYPAAHGGLRRRRRRETYSENDLKNQCLMGAKILKKYFLLLF